MLKKLNPPSALAFIIRGNKVILSLAGIPHNGGVGFRSPPSTIKYPRTKGRDWKSHMPSMWASLTPAMWDSCRRKFSQALHGSGLAAASLSAVHLHYSPYDSGPDPNHGLKVKYRHLKFWKMGWVSDLTWRSHRCKSSHLAIQLKISGLHPSHWPKLALIQPKFGWTNTRPQLMCKLYLWPGFPSMDPACWDTTYYRLNGHHQDWTVMHFCSIWGSDYP